MPNAAIVTDCIGPKATGRGAKSAERPFIEGDSGTIQAKRLSNTIPTAAKADAVRVRERQCVGDPPINPCERTGTGSNGSSENTRPNRRVARTATRPEARGMGTTLRGRSHTSPVPAPPTTGREARIGEEVDLRDGAGTIL